MDWWMETKNEIKKMSFSDSKYPIPVEIHSAAAQFLKNIIMTRFWIFNKSTQEWTLNKTTEREYLLANARWGRKREYSFVCIFAFSCYMMEEEPLAVGMAIMFDVLGTGRPLLPLLLVLAVATLPSWRKEASGCSIQVMRACSAHWCDA